MPRRARGSARVADAAEVAAAPVAALDDNFLDTLKGEFARVQRSANAPKPGEDLSHRAEVNRRLLQDFWEIHNQFDDVGSHLTIEPSQTLFATFAEFPDKWSFRENFDFGAVKTIELRDRTQGWVGFTLRFWFYNTAEGRPHFRGVFEWTEGETYHRYSGWMRMMSQAVLYDSGEHTFDVRTVHSILRDVVVKWYQAHVDRAPEAFIAHLKEKYPKGASYAKESYRE
ncbi:MAG TPA: hypothetical protein VKT21_00050 [Thermoplasmata archaeon]|nr:hypothetical protein [Thermoplasmata archaeon]